MGPSITAALAVIAAINMGPGVAGAEPVPDAPSAGASMPVVNAVWVERKQFFTYFGENTYYSCDGLRDKVRYILKLAGARDDLTVSTSCIQSGGGIEAMPGVRIRAHFAQEATPELLEQLAEGAAKRELIARVSGKGHDVDDATAQFPATWQRVEIEGERRGRIASGDCELLEQLLRYVLEPAGVRVAGDPRLGCMRHSTPIRAVRFQLDTLQPVPPPDATSEPPADAAPGPGSVEA